MNYRLAIIALCLASAIACGSDSSPSNPSPSGTVVSVVSGASLMTTTAYAPNPLTVSVGGTVTWVNNDNTTHTSTANDGSWNGSIAPGGQFSRTFSTAGTFPYHCTIHPGMVGTVNVQ